MAPHKVTYDRREGLPQHASDGRRDAEGGGGGGGGDDPISDTLIASPRTQKALRESERMLEILVTQPVCAIGCNL